MSKPRQMTPEEVREAFMQRLAQYVSYWATVEGQSVEQRLSGLAFSFLNILDGGSGLLPAFDVVPSPHPADKAFLEGEGENWWPESSLPDSAVTLHSAGGPLHDLWPQYDPFK